jgi:hypothetical protein
MGEEIRLAVINNRQFRVGLVPALFCTVLISLSGTSNFAGQQAEVSKIAEITFKLDRVSDGKTENGIWTHREEYVASDREKVYVDHMKFDSPTTTTSAAKLAASRATKIIEASQRRSKDGTVIGERTLAIFPFNVSSKADSGVKVFSLIWTNGLSYIQITSNSQRDVLAMENFLKLQ